MTPNQTATGPQPQYPRPSPTITTGPHATKYSISKRLGELANAIKDVGNGSTHNIFETISKNEAEYILGFMDLLIEQTYQQDERLKKLSKLNRQLEQAKTEKLSNTFKES